MDRSKGGYVIIDLTSLALSATESATDITSPEILKQLLDLHEYGLYSKKSLKPIYIRAIDENGVECTSLCELDRNNGVLRIKAFIMDAILQIFIAYDVDSETQEVLIDSATYEYVSEHDKVAEIIGEGDIENAKPIYCHPISIDDDTSNDKVHIAMLILDNSDEEYNTLEKLTAKLNAIFALNSNAVFPITGALYYSSGNALHVAQKIALSGNIIFIYTSRPDGTQGNFTFGTYLANATIYDGVNKIN